MPSNLNLEDWLEDTFQWIQSPDENERQNALLRNEPIDAPTHFSAPSEVEWPFELLKKLPEFLEGFFQESRDIDLTAKRVDQVVENLAVWVQQYLQKLRRTPSVTQDDVDQTAHNMVIAWKKLYQTIQPFHAFHSEEAALRTLMTTPSSSAITTWCDLMIFYPPSHYRTASASVETLTRRRDWSSADIFPQLLNALEHPTTIASVLDLANWVMRNESNIEHPAKEFEPKLQSLLIAVVERLEKLESNPTSFGADIRAIQRILDESVALCISLCDTIGLMSGELAKPGLMRAAKLRHRRIACEAAAALARLGDAHGKALLLELAAEPVARLRVLHYAEELELLDEVDDTWKSEYAKAESQLATWLAAPDNFGIAPKQIELVDQRNLMWPSYTEPQTCYLLRFTYPLASGQYTNIGIAGPLVYAFNADMADLPEMDIYAAFAGWQAEHPEIFEISRSEFTSSQLDIAMQLNEALQREDYSEVHIEFLGSFLGETVLVAIANHGGSEGVVVYDGTEKLWYPSTGRTRPVGVHEAYSIYKGRRFLRAFNPEL